MLDNKRYFLDQDQSSHWYLVEEKFRDQWNIYINLDEDDPQCWDIPIYAKQLLGHPKNVSFENPTYE